MIATILAYVDIPYVELVVNYAPLEMKLFKQFGFSLDGASFNVVPLDDSARIIDKKTGKILHKLRLTKNFIFNDAINKDSNRLILASLRFSQLSSFSKKIKIWDLKEFDRIKRYLETGLTFGQVYWLADVIGTIQQNEILTWNQESDYLVFKSLDCAVQKVIVHYLKRSEKNAHVAKMIKKENKKEKNKNNCLIM